MESKPLPPDVPKFLREFATRFENSVNGSRVILGELEGSVLEADTLRVLADAIARQEPLVRPQPHEDFASYQREAHRTAGTMPERDRVFMASMGLAGEAGEVVDELKKVHFHAKPFDRTKLVRELGDVLWYLAELATAHGVDLQEVAFVNLAKLRARHGGETFKPHAEQDRSPEACAREFDNRSLWAAPTFGVILEKAERFLDNPDTMNARGLAVDLASDVVAFARAQPVPPVALDWSKTRKGWPS